MKPALALLVLLALAGCKLRVETNDEPVRPSLDMQGIRVRIDPDTGCHYLTHGSAITPRLTADGKPLCIL